VPDVGRSNPVMRLTSVDLPAPLGPNQATRPRACPQLERDGVERLHALERARDGERPQRSLRRGTVGGLAQRLSMGTALRWPRTAPGATAGSCHADQIFGTTLAVTEPMTLSFVPEILITRYWRPNTVWQASARS